MIDPDPSPAARQGPDPFFDTWPEIKNPTPESKQKIYSGELKIIFTEGKRKPE